MSKRFLLILLAAVLILVGIFWFTRNKAAAPSTSGNIKPSTHIEGQGAKGVTLIEYGDFQCPACEAYYPLVQQVVQKYSNDIFFQYRNFPLVQIHNKAMLGHRAAEAASQQGKFFEMYNQLYGSQSQWVNAADTMSVLREYATQIGLNLDKFNQDFNSDLINSTINADIQEGQKLQITGTPTFVLDGQKITNNPQDLTGFYKLIDDEIAKKNPPAAQPH